jgi:phosphoglycolate phosphatase-like HAD superfamily hydrolase
MAEPAVLLDLDGTLVALDPPQADLERLRGRLLALAGRHAVAVAHRGILRIYDQLYAGLGAGHPALGEARALLDEHERTWAAHTARTLLNPAGTAALDRLAGAWTVVTNNGTACLRELVSRGLVPAGHAAAVTRDAGLPLKPSPDPLAAALGHRDGGVFVGDGDADEQAAAAYGAGLRFVRVTGDGVNDVLTGLVAAQGSGR